MEAPSGNFYSAVSDYLQQGDVFRTDVVAPFVDTQKRLFRTDDGRHGSVVFSGEGNGRVFDREELRAQLQECSRTPLHTDPFEPTPDGHPELVVAHAQLFSFFVIATQTCDVSGVDKTALPTSIILPILTVKDVCRSERLPFQRLGNAVMTIENFLENYAGADDLKGEHDPFAYPDLIRERLASWKPGSTALEESRNRVRKYLGKMHEAGWVYFLRAAKEFGVPEGYISFSVAYTVPTETLGQLASSRVARLGDPYRDQFAKAFADRLSRIAVPATPKPDAF